MLYHLTIFETFEAFQYFYFGRVPEEKSKRSLLLTFPLGKIFQIFSNFQFEAPRSDRYLAVDRQGVSMEINPFFFLLESFLETGDACFEFVVAFEDCETAGSLDVRDTFATVCTYFGRRNDKSSRDASDKNRIYTVTTRSSLR